MPSDTEESYDYDEVTPADDTVTLDGTTYIVRVGEPYIPVGCGATCAEGVPDSEGGGVSNAY